MKLSNFPYGNERWRYGICALICLFLPVSLLAEEEAPEDTDGGDGNGSLTVEPTPEQRMRAASRLGRLELKGKEVLLRERLELPPSAVPILRAEDLKRLVKAVEALPKLPQELTRAHLFELYKVAGPKGVHWLYDTGRLKKGHAQKFKSIRDVLNGEILEHVAKKKGRIGVNNFGSGDTCRSDHDQTLYSHTTDVEPADLIREYNERFHEILVETKGVTFAKNFTPELIELSNFDGTETFPDWRLVKQVGKYTGELVAKGESIRGNPEAYYLVGAFREIVDSGTFDTPRTYTLYHPDGRVDKDADASLHIYRGLKPARRRSHAAGAAVGNWFFYNHHGGGKDPIEKAKYFLRNVGFGGYLMSTSKEFVENEQWKGHMYEKLADDFPHLRSDPEGLRNLQDNYIRRIFGDISPVKVKEYRMALNLAARIRKKRAEAVDIDPEDPDSKTLNLDMVKEWCRDKVAHDMDPDARDRKWDSYADEVRQDYERVQREMMAATMVKAIPELAGDWLEPPKDMERIRKKMKFKKILWDKDLPKLQHDDAMRDALAMTAYHEMRGIMKTLLSDKTEALKGTEYEGRKLVDQLIKSCKEGHRNRLMAVRDSVLREIETRNAKPEAESNFFRAKANEIKAAYEEMKSDARFAGWKLEEHLQKFGSDPAAASKEVGQRAWEEIRSDLSARLGRDAKVHLDELGKMKMTTKYSTKAFFRNNANVANGMAVVGAVNAYMEAETADPGSGAAAFRDALALAIYQQLPFVGEYYDLKDAAVDSNFLGIGMNIASRYAPGLFKRYLVIGFVADAAVASVKLVGWTIFEQVEGDTADKLYLGMLPAKSPGLFTAGNPELADTYLPSLLAFVDEITPEDKERARFTPEEEEDLDADIARRAENGDFPDDSKPYLAAEKKRRLVWLWIKKLIDAECVRLGVVRTAYDDDEHGLAAYRMDRSEVGQAMLEGRTASLINFPNEPYDTPLLKNLVSRFARGELIRDDTDREMLATIRGHVSRDGEFISPKIQQRLLLRLTKDYYDGLKAHTEYVTQDAIADKKASIGFIDTVLKYAYAIRDAFESKASEAYDKLSGQIIGEYWIEHDMPPIEAAIRIDAYRVEAGAEDALAEAEEREETGEGRRSPSPEPTKSAGTLHARVTVYGSAEDHPLPWKGKIALRLDDKEVAAAAIPPREPVRVKDEEGQPGVVIPAAEEETPIEATAPNPDFVHTLRFFDSEDRPLVFGTIRPPGPLPILESGPFAPRFEAETPSEYITKGLDTYVRMIPPGTWMRLANDALGELEEALEKPPDERPVISFWMQRAPETEGPWETISAGHAFIRENSDIENNPWDKHPTYGTSGFLFVDTENENTLLFTTPVPTRIPGSDDPEGDPTENLKELLDTFSTPMEDPGSAPYLRVVKGVHLPTDLPELPVSPLEDDDESVSTLVTSEVLEPEFDIVYIPESEDFPEDWPDEAEYPLTWDTTEMPFEYRATRLADYYIVRNGIDPWIGWLALGGTNHGSFVGGQRFEVTFRGDTREFWSYKARMLDFLKKHEVPPLLPQVGQFRFPDFLPGSVPPGGDTLKVVTEFRGQPLVKEFKVHDVEMDRVEPGEGIDFQQLALIDYEEQLEKVKVLQSRIGIDPENLAVFPEGADELNEDVIDAILMSKSEHLEHLRERKAGAAELASTYREMRDAAFDDWKLDLYEDTHQVHREQLQFFAKEIKGLEAKLGRVTDAEERAEIARSLEIVRKEMREERAGQQEYYRERYEHAKEGLAGSALQARLWADVKRRLDALSEPDWKSSTSIPSLDEVLRDWAFQTADVAGFEKWLALRWPDGPPDPSDRESGRSRGVFPYIEDRRRLAQLIVERTGDVARAVEILAAAEEYLKGAMLGAGGEPETVKAMNVLFRPGWFPVEEQERPGSDEDPSDPAGDTAPPDEQAKAAIAKASKAVGSRDLYWAKAAYEDAAKADPSSTVAKVGLAETLDYLGETDEAIALLEELGQNSPDAAGAAARLGSIFTGKRQFEDAHSLLSERVNNVPDDALAWSHHASNYLEAGQAEDALRVFRHARKLGPSVAERRLAGGWLYFQQGQHLRALTEFQAAAYLAPEAADPWKGMALAYEAIGRDEWARTAAENYLARTPEGGWAEWAREMLAATATN